jgi:hypothetical protein
METGYNCEFTHESQLVFVTSETQSQSDQKGFLGFGLFQLK